MPKTPATLEEALVRIQELEKENDTLRTQKSWGPFTERVLLGVIAAAVTILGSGGFIQQINNAHRFDQIAKNQAETVEVLKTPFAHPKQAP